jgi:PleD family two-component response regulator
LAWTVSLPGSDSQGDGLADVTARSAPLPPRAAKDAESRARVLVVDDEESLTNLVATVLRCAGFRVEVAASGRAALKAAASFRPT